MTRYLKAFVCLAAAFILAPAPAQTADQTKPAAKPVPIVYVARPTHIDGFVVASNGKLTPVPGSPLANIAVASLAGNGKYLFGSTSDGTHIDAFSIASNGSLTLSASTEVDNVLSGACVYASPLLLDHTGATLYAAATVGGLCDSTDYESFQIESGGTLKYLGDSGQTFLYNKPLTISSNNNFAFGADCVDYEGGYIDTFAAYARSSSGHLALDGSITAPVPKTKSTADFYCRSQAAGDPSSHIAVSLQAINSDSQSPDGSPQLATYSANSHGDLTTKSTYANMPVSATGVNVLAMSPSGKLLAVGGQGLQIFHFNGSSPITKDSGVLQPAVAFNALAWDSENHLYALSGGQLFVYTVTSSSISQATGSPYSIPEAVALVVQSVTP